MLEPGVLGGKYMTDCRDEFPAAWFKKARLCHERHDPELNDFGINASQPLSEWLQDRLDPSRGSARLGPVVLPLLHGQALSG